MKNSYRTRQGATWRTGPCVALLGVFAGCSGGGSEGASSQGGAGASVTVATTDTTSGAGGAGGVVGAGGGGAGGAGGSGGAGGAEPFPRTPGNVFSIQYRNSTDAPVAVWLEGSIPPCSSALALQCDAAPGGVPWNPAEYALRWAERKTVFEVSGTHFYRLDGNGVSQEIDVAPRVELQPGETLRIVPPLKNGLPEWYFARNGVVTTTGTKGWVTRLGADMPASMSTLLFEYFVATESIYWDLGGVDGINANASMSYDGPGCGAAEHCGCDAALPKACRTSLQPYADGSDGCPLLLERGGATVCPNPKFYPANPSEFDPAAPKAPWVVSTSEFTTDSVSTDYPALWNDAGQPTGAELADAASGDPLFKPAYHVWWGTNPVGQAWTNYLQANAAGACDAYAWAYDEKKWKPGDTFDANGNPPDDNPIRPLVTCAVASDTYLDIDLLDVL